MYSTLIEPAELVRLLAQTPVGAGREPNVAILDCRHELSRPDWGDHAYADGHIPNALQAHLDRDLSGQVGPQTGRHPLPDAARLVEKLSSWGIDRDVQVVAYDQGNGVYAARAWWLLRWLGHTSVAVLDGGFAAWQEAGLPVSREAGARTPRRFVAHTSDGAAVTTAQLQQALASEAVALVDARGADRFAGENETIDPIAGHVPGASNRPFGKNVDSRGRFLPAAELRRQWDEVLGARPPAELVAMCGSGVSACHNLLALEIAGLPGARLYPGSWSEWIRDPARPVARGSS
ncbi:MAG TPA: sulfurtransferase [Steroidobacteraceae bacterium]|nr:sulfurtransferase [Steroidobacteraceae bacterium]